MRMRFLYFAISLLLAGVSLGLQDLKEIPENITFEAARRGPVDFPHVLHHDLGLTCQTCHHNMPEEAERPEQACRDCHTPDSEVTNMKAFHTTCLTCHREENRNRSAKLPFKCSDCHQRE